MIIEYCRSKTYNFGDDLNPWLWPKLLGVELFNKKDGVYFVGIGTVLTSKRLNVQLADAKEIVIFSSGAWDDNAPKLSEKCKVYGVRGPRTAEKLGLSEDKVIGDGAYLLRKIDLPKVDKSSKVGFIPHHGSEEYVDWGNICDQLGIKFISAKQPVDNFLNQLRSCEKIVTEAMHGAIVADAMRIPWVPVKFSPLFCEEKWYDFAESMSLNLTFNELPFYNQKPMPVFKMVEVGFKKFISRSLGVKPKWSTLILTGRGQGNKGMVELLESLSTIIDSSITYLSEDEVVNRITDKQYNILLQIKADYS